MPKEVKTGTAKTQVPESTFVSLLSGWVQQGIENFLAMQRILVDLAVRQNSGVVNFVRERVADPEYCPMATVGEALGEGVSNFIEGQKLLLSLVKQESEIVAHGVKERVAGFTPAVAVTDVMQGGLDAFVQMHQDFLKNASKQMHAWLAAVKAGKTYDSEGLIELARDSFDTFVHTQKKFLDLIQEETTKATATNGTKHARKTQLVELAQQAADAFVEAQKKMMDLAGKQVTVGLKATGRVLEMVAPERNPLPEMTRAGVKTFVDTEKALIDTVTRRRAETKVGGKAAARRKPRARRIKVEMAAV